jgi:hypothetical protein
MISRKEGEPIRMSTGPSRCHCGSAKSSCSNAKPISVLLLH